MAISDPYASAADYRQRFINKVSSADEGRVDRALLAASRWIEAHNGEFYNRDASPVARVFMAESSGCLNVAVDGSPGIATATGLLVALDTTQDYTYPTSLVIGTDFELADVNAAFGPEPKPYRELRTLTGASYGWSYRVRVTAVFGWPAVPEGIRSGCVELAGILLGDSPLAARQFTDVGSVGASLEAREIVRGMIDVYGPGIVAV